MKFTRDEALQDLKAQFTKKGKTLKLSDRTISDTLENLMSFATEETELAAFSASAFKTLDSMNGNHIKDTSDFVKEWNEAHPQPTPAPTPTPEPTPPAPSNDFAELIKKMDAISQELTGIKTKSKTEMLIQTAEGLFTAKKPDPKWKGIQDKAKAIVNTRITAETTADVLVEEYDKEYNELLSAFGAEGAYVPADDKGGGGGFREGTAEFYAEQKKQLEAKGIIKN